jgi:hypothetical protein
LDGSRVGYKGMNTFKNLRGLGRWPRPIHL